MMISNINMLMQSLPSGGLFLFCIAASVTKCVQNLIKFQDLE